MTNLFYFFVLLIVHIAYSNPAVSGSETNAVSKFCQKQEKGRKLKDTKHFNKFSFSLSVKNKWKIRF